MEHFKLKDYKIKKGVLISPFNEIMTPLSKDLAWFTGRCPEYLWIGLILNAYERIDGINKCLFIIEKLHEIEPNLPAPAWSEIIKLNKEKQNDFFSYLNENIDSEVLAPMTCLTSANDCPIFIEYFLTSLPLNKRLEKIIALLNKISDHQTNDATDIRYIVLFHNIMSGKIRMPKETFEMLNEYRYITHDNVKMRRIRPTIRSMEQIVLNDFNRIDNKNYLNKFWDIVSQCTDCKCFYLKLKEEQVDTKPFMDKVYSICKYYQELVKIQPLDNKLLVLTSIAVYSYKRLLELVEHNLFNEITGRTIARNIIENYIMIKYLLKHENEHEDIWSEFQYYGIGKLKLVIQKDREKDKVNENNHLNYTYLQALIGEYTREDFIDMDLRYFDQVGIRDKAIDVEEKDLYDLLYDYDSQFEHGLWGAIRESTLVKCDNPAHQYHCIPDIDDLQKLPTVWNDCSINMIKILNVLKSEFGLPSHLEIEDGI